MKEYYCSNCGKLFEENAVPSSCPDCGCPASEFKEKEITAVAPTMADTITEKKVDQDHVTPSSKSFKISLGFTIAGLILLVMTIVALLSNDVFSSTWNMVWLFFWLYMGAFGVYQMNTFPDIKRIVPYVSVLICLFFIVNAFLYDFFYSLRSVQTITLWCSILYGLCMLLNSANFRGFAKYAFAGCGILWVVSECTRRYSTHVSLVDLYFAQSPSLYPFPSETIQLLIYISILVSIFGLLIYWGKEIKHSKQEESKRHILSLIETMSLIVALIMVVMAIFTPMDEYHIDTARTLLISLRILPIVGILSLFGSLTYSSKKSGYIFSAILFVGSMCGLYEPCNMTIGGLLIFNRDFFEGIFPVLGSITLLSIIIFTMSCFVPNLKSKFNLKLK